MNSRAQFYEWVKDVVLPGAFHEQDYNGDFLEDFGFTSDLNVLIAVIS